MDEEHYEDEALKRFRRQARIISLLSGAETGGLSPLPLTQLHSFAYLVNVLSPVWAMPPLDPRVLKLRHGPYYPALQHDLDDLIGRSLIRISDIEYMVDEDRNGHRLNANVELNWELVQRALDVLWSFSEERRLQIFVEELAIALATLTSEELDFAVSEDATYGNSMVAYDDVVDFGEYRDRNYSANAATYLGGLLPSGTSTTPGEKLHLYVQHLRERLSNAE